MEPKVYGLYQPGQQGFSPKGEANLRKFEKEAIRTGTWKLSDGRSFQVTRKRMDRWVRQFRAMQRAGLRVPFPVDHSSRSEDNWGWVEAMERRHNTLYVTVDVPLDAHAEKLGTTIKEVSIGQKASFVDGSGKEWTDVLTHVSPCTEPVVSKQENFAPLPVAASQRAGEAQTAEVIHLRHSEEGDPMDFEVMVREALGLKKDASDDDVLAGLKALKEKGGNDDESKVLRQVKTERDNAVAELGKVRDQLTALKAGGAQGKDDDEDPATVELRNQVAQLHRENAEAQAEALLREGKITPAMKDGVVTLLSRRAKDANLRNDKGEDSSVGAELHTLLRSLPKGAALDLAERTKLTEVPNPNNTDEEPTEAELRNKGKELAALSQRGAPDKGE